jgi:SAM-dependent methyltransferase
MDAMMTTLTDDATTRQDTLERWAAQQRRTNQSPAAASLRTVRFRTQQRAWLAQIKLARASERVASYVLDRGLNTSGFAHEPEHDHPDRLHYAPVSWHVVPRALRYLGVSDLDTFVDFGCGKGRAVHQAAKRPFRRVIGVEISPALADAARSGLAARKHQHQCRDVEIVVADVTKYQVPDDLTVGFFYHPVALGSETLDAVLRRIEESLDRNPRRVRLIYVVPIGWQPPDLASDRFRVLKKQRRIGIGPSRVAIFESC